MAHLIQVFIAISITVSFLVMGSAMKHTSKFILLILCHFVHLMLLLHRQIGWKRKYLMTCLLWKIVVVMLITQVIEILVGYVGVRLVVQYIKQTYSSTVHLGVKCYEWNDGCVCVEPQ